MAVYHVRISAHDEGSRSAMSELVITDDELAEQPSDDDDPSATAKRRHRVFVDWVLVIGVALLVAFLVRTFLLAHFVVDGPSMLTTLHDDDRVFVNKLSYR